MPPRMSAAPAPRDGAACASARRRRRVAWAATSSALIRPLGPLPTRARGRRPARRPASWPWGWRRPPAAGRPRPRAKPSPVPPRRCCRAVTSSRVIRPPGPLPKTKARSTPSSAASFLAAGEATIRSPGARCGADGALPPQPRPFPPPQCRRALPEALTPLGAAEGGDVLARLTDHRDGVADRRLPVLGEDDLEEHSLRLGLQLVGDLLGRDLGDHVADFDLIALAGTPGAHDARLHQQSQLGHDHDLGHVRPPVPAPRPRSWAP